MKRLLFPLALLLLIAAALYGGMTTNRLLAKNACAKSGGTWDAVHQRCVHDDSPTSPSEVTSSH